jgi:hypothetical protein
LKDPLKHYEASLKIDKDNLDDELSLFPSAFYTICDYLIDADRRAKRLGQRLSREKAAIATVLRDVAREEGGARSVTETQIKQEVSLHPKVRTLTAKHAQAEKHAKRWETLKEAMVQKSFSLKGLVSLAMHEQYQSAHATVNGSASVSRKRSRN